MTFFISSPRRLLVAALAFCLLVSTASAGQRPFDGKELAEYRLTLPVFKQFAHATRLMMTAARHDAALASAPLFTREISVSGDAPEMATALQARLEGHPALVAALFAADLDARAYTKFALALFAARLADGFMTAGVLRSVPPGVAADNLAFVAAHRAEVATVLQEMGVEGP